MSTISEEIAGMKLVTTRQLMQDFYLMLQQANRRITEADFKLYFLNTFLGNNKENPEEVISYWYKVAGSPYAEVDIVDANGNVLDTVPPILVRDIIPLVKNDEKEMSVESAMELSAQVATLSPNLATQRLAETLNSKFISVEQKAVDPIKERWSSLLMKYMPKEGLSTISSSSNKPAVDSMFEYD